MGSAGVEARQAGVKQLECRLRVAVGLLDIGELEIYAHREVEIAALDQQVARSGEVPARSREIATGRGGAPTHLPGVAKIRAPTDAAGEVLHLLRRGVDASQPQSVEIDHGAREERMRQSHRLLPVEQRNGLLDEDSCFLWPTEIVERIGKRT